MRSVRAYLLTLAVGLILLSSLAFALLTYDAERTSRQQTEEQLRETANALSLAVDGELEGALGILSAIAASNGVQSRDWAAVDRQGRAALRSSDSWLIVQDRSGRQLVNTGLARGAVLPIAPPPEDMWDELSSGQPRICNLVGGAIEPNIVCVDMPLGSSGNTEYAMSVVLRPQFFDTIVQRQQVDAGHVAALLDRSGRLIWRNISPEQFVGKPATPDVRAAIRSSTGHVMESTTLDGTRSVAAFKRSELSGWSVIVGTPLKEAGAGPRQAQWRGSFIAVAILIIGCVVALFVGRHVSRAVRKVAVAARSGALGTDRPLEATGFDELDELQAAFREAATERAKSEERYRRIFEQSSDLIITADLDQVITDCNPSAAAAVGLDRQDAIGRRISDFISPEDFDRTTAMLRQKIESGGTTRYDVRVRSSTGNWLFWEINSGLTYDGSGQPVGLHVVGRDVTDRKRWENHQQLLVGELNHRVKNTLSIVQSLSHQTFRGNAAPGESIAAFEARLKALAAAHNLLTRESWSAASMRELISMALAPFCTDGRCRIEGPDLRVHPNTAVTLTLAIHELATNASKYGALSNEEGAVEVVWGVMDEQLHLTWREAGGPPVVEPTSAGFGTKLIKRGLASELGGVVDLRFEADGVVCSIRAPLPIVEEI